jgi:hypothetical protein
MSNQILIKLSVHNDFSFLWFIHSYWKKYIFDKGELFVKSSTNCKNTKYVIQFNYIQTKNYTGKTGLYFPKLF